jgi:hypothetical protein
MAPILQFGHNQQRTPALAFWQKLQLVDAFHLQPLLDPARTVLSQATYVNNVL